MHANSLKTEIISAFILVSPPPMHRKKSYQRVDEHLLCTKYVSGTVLCSFMGTFFMYFFYYLMLMAVLPSSSWLNLIKKLIGEVNMFPQDQTVVGHQPERDRKG